MKYVKGLIILLFLFICLSTYSNPVGAIFIPQNQFDDVEFLMTTSILDSAGLIYYVFSEKDDTCFGRSGYKILPFTVMDSVEDYPLDFLILNGGIGTYYYADNLRLREIIKRADSEKKIIVASNFAPILFMKDSMLQGRSINFVRNKITEDLEKKYKFKYLPGPVIVSENLITSPSSEFVRLYLNEFLKKYYETFSSESE